MHPDDVEEMRLTKDANGNYIIPPFADLSTFSIRGTKIIESTLVPQNQMYIGDFSFGTVYTSRNLMLEIANQHGTDFLSDILRMKATSRKALVIRNVHAGAFLHVASISQAITDLTKP
jgi:HK97 family phage major capsid protein